MSALACDWCGERVARASLVQIGDALVCRECDRLAEDDSLPTPAPVRGLCGMRSEDGEHLGRASERAGGRGRE